MSTAVNAPHVPEHGAAKMGSIPLPVAASLSTMEVRWILPGRRPPDLSGWLRRFPIATETRDDLYFVHPRTGGLSVKVRGTSLLEFKLQQDESRVLDVAGLPSVRVQACEKWSFHLAAGSLGIPVDGQWMRVRKDRILSRLSAAGRPTGPGAPRGRETSACEVELTDVQVDQEHWWTVALEATGSGTEAWTAICAAAATLLADGMPARAHLRSSQPRSYGDWLQSLCRVG